MIKVDAGRLWRRDYPLHAKPVGVVWLAARLAARVVPHRGGTRLASSLRKRLRSPPAVGDQSGAAEGVRVLRHEIIGSDLACHEADGAEDKPDFVQVTNARPAGLRSKV